MNDAVDGCICADAERKGQDCREREAGGFAELSKGISQICQHG